MTKTETAPVQIRHQNWMLALRDLAGVPTIKPVDESILFCGTALNGLQSGMELARLAQKAERDVICAHWATRKRSGRWATPSSCAPSCPSMC